jgi:hypothetical protein
VITITDLCTIEQVKTESAGRITDDSLDTEITYKITDLSEKILAIDSSLTTDDRTARMCCIYGVLGWLTNNKKISTNKEITSFKSGNFSVNYTKTSTEKEQNSDCENYYKLLGELKPLTDLHAKARRRSWRPLYGRY